MKNYFLDNTLGLILKDLNAVASPLSVNGGHDAFHKAVINAIEPLMIDGLQITVWKIKYEGREVFTYGRTFEKDKRTSDFNARGKFTNIQFTTDFAAHLTGNELLVLLAKRDVINAIDNTKANILSLENSLNKERVYLAGKEKELLKFESATPCP